MAEEWIEQQSSVEYVHFFDLEGKEADCTAAEQAITDRLTSQMPGIQCESRQQSRDSFYDLYGAMFFIGIYLGVLFLIAAVLIIYYKQISEGYDDKERFQIMQKVGMDQREVRRTIRSQVLTVFFLPLAMAVLHVASCLSGDQKTDGHPELYQHTTVSSLHRHMHSRIRGVLCHRVRHNSAGVLQDRAVNGGRSPFAKDYVPICNLPCTFLENRVYPKGFFGND
ncbi:FtsX-like permease family protein [uncultured Merdimonas sp.]|uniref:ABC transporter permease n=1 Tax=uncultured Merdimonas sp. TaxID=2023269 RepID=UPI0032090578